MRRRWWAVLPLGLLAVSAWAAGTPDVRVEVRVERELREMGMDGVEHTVLLPVQDVHPGDVLVCTAQYRNAGSGTAVNAAVTEPVPTGTSLVPNSTSAGHARVEYSLDGRSFGGWPQITPAYASGQVATVDAPAAAVRHVRFVLREPVPAGSSGSVSFKVVVQ
jgi:uncharacterized repeat protein (TIGR01451 family)